VLNLRLNYTFMYESSTYPSEGLDATTLGFPSYLAGNAQRQTLPYVYFDTSTGFRLSATMRLPNGPPQSVQLYASWTKLKGNHTFRAGADLRQYRLSTITYGVATGSFNFGNRWVNQNASASLTESMGQDLAQLLYGLPTQGTYNTTSIPTVPGMRTSAPDSCKTIGA
jgi:hypothetical protein